MGREAELRLLRAGLDSAAAGSGAAFVIVGDVGIGKTRLADRVAREATDRGFMAIRGSGWEGGGAPPYWPWRTLLRACGALALATPTEAEVFDGHPAPGAADELDSAASASRRFRLFDRVAATLAAVAARQPLLIVLDDLHAADPDSLLLFQFATRALRHCPSVLIGLRRSYAPETGGLDVAAVGGDATVLALRGLDPTETAQLVRHVTGRSEFPSHGGEPAGDAIATLHAMAHGNPFLVRALAHWWYVASDWVPGDEEAVLPFQVREFVRQRLGSVAPGTVRFLGVAAIVGREFDLETVATAMTAAPPPVGALDEARTQGVVAPLEGSPGRFRFVSPLVRDVLYADLPRYERAEWHARVADAIVDAHGLRPDRQRPQDAAAITQVADHYHRAAGAGREWEATRYAVLAAHCATDAHAYEHAVVHWRRALHAIDGAPPTDGAPERDRCEVLLGLGTALNAAGARDEACRTFVLAADEAREHGDPELLARAAHGYAGEWIGYLELARPGDPSGLSDPALQALLHQALGALPKGSSWRPVLQARLAVELYLVAPLDHRRELVDEALATARTHCSAAAYGQVMCAAHVAVWTPDNLAERRDLARRIIELGRQTQQPAIEGAGLTYAIADELEGGDGAAASVAADALRHLAARTRLPGLGWAVAVHDAAQALLAGRFAEAAALARAARDDAGAPREAAVVAHALQRATIRLAVGRADELRNALPLWTELARRHPRMTAFHSLLALVHAELGETARARRFVDELAADRFARIERNNVWLHSMSQVVDAAWLCDDPTHAAVLYELLLPFAERTVVGLFNAVVSGSVARSLGQVAALCGRVDDAERHFRAALERDRALGSRPLVAQTRCAWAHVRLRCGVGGREAIELLRRARATAQELGMAALERHCAELEPRPGGGARERPPRAGEGAGATRDGGAEEQVFRREGDYWTLTYAGRTVRAKHVVGLTHIATLLARPHEEIPAAILATLDVGVSPPPDGWCAADVLDVEARAAYRERLAALRGSLLEAEQHGQAARAEAVQHEIDALAGELARATGLGGRQRRTGSPAERARVNVTRAIATAIARVRAQHGPLGDYLARTIRTGTSCAYRPGSGSGVEWTV